MANDAGSGLREAACRGCALWLNFLDRCPVGRTLPDAPACRHFKAVPEPYDTCEDRGTKWTRMGWTTWWVCDACGAQAQDPTDTSRPPHRCIGPAPALASHPEAPPSSAPAPSTAPTAESAPANRHGPGCEQLVGASDCSCAAPAAPEVDPRDEGERCQRCGRRYTEVWRAPDVLWANVTGRDDGGGLRCMPCFASEAVTRGIALYWEARALTPSVPGAADESAPAGDAGGKERP